MGEGELVHPLCLINSIDPSCIAAAVCIKLSGDYTDQRKVNLICNPVVIYVHIFIHDHTDRFPQNRTLDSKKGADKHSPLRFWVAIAGRNVSLSRFFTRKWSLSYNLFNHTNELEPPTSLWKGEGWMQWGAGISERVWAFELEPTSLKRGEGLISEFQRLVEGEMGGEGEDGGSGMGGE